MNSEPVRDMEEEENAILPLPPFKKLAVISAADVIGGNIDILTLVLLGLPVKSLARFKLVSKQWQGLISNPRFTKAHTKFRIQTHPNSPISISGLYLYDPFDSSRRISSQSLSNGALPSISFLEAFCAKQGTIFRVLQSCNGLLLCMVICQCIGSNWSVVIVLNPATRSGHVIPFAYNDPAEMELVIGFGLVFDPLVSLHFKVVCIKRLNPTSVACEFSIYTSENDSWRKAGREYYPPLYMSYDRGFFWNGGIHWIGDYYSVYFEPDSEKMIIMEMPPKPQGPSVHKTRYIGECLGHLHFIQIKSLFAVKFNVLEMNKNSLKWFVKYRVHLGRIVSAFPDVARTIRKNDGSEEVSYEFNILGVVREEKEVESKLILAIPPGRVISYNFARKTLQLLSEVAAGGAVENFRIDCFHAHSYGETLASVK